MKKLLMFFSILLLITVVILFFALPKKTAIEHQPINGLMIKSLNNADFPSAPNLSAKALRKEIDRITEYAIAAGYNALFFEVRSQGDALYSSSIFPTSQFLLKKQGSFTLFDPLGELTKAAAKKGLLVYAVVDPYTLGTDLSVLSKKSPAVKDNTLTEFIRETYQLKPDNAQVVRLNTQDLSAMAKRYRLSAIIIENAHATDGQQSAVSTLLKTCKEAIDSRTRLGLMLPDKALEEDFSSAFEYCDLVLPSISIEVTPEGGGYKQRLLAWKQAIGDRLVPIIDVKNADLSAVQLTAQVFEAEQNGVLSRVTSNYGALLENTGFIGDLLSSIAFESAYVPTALDYAPAQSLTITRPAYVLSVNTSSYFIMGTSDPAQALTLNGQPVTRDTADGVFGIKVSLNMGDNSFTFRQGDSSETVVINRTDGSAEPVTTVNVSSMSPKSSLLVYNDTEFSISCVAPAGKIVTATLGNTTVTLKQNTVAVASIPATFSGKMTITGALVGEVKNLGSITYAISDGESAVSGGNVYLMGSNATAYMRVTEFVASVFPDNTVTEGNYKSVYKAGVIEEISGQMGEYYQLASGGYIKKATVEVVDAAIAKPLTLTAVAEQHSDRAERFILAGLSGVPYTFLDEENGSCTVVLHQTGTAVKLSSLPTESTLFSEMRWTISGRDLKCALTPRDTKKVWGIDILNDGTNAVLYAKKAPVLSEATGKPMQNIVVVLDPGHGGTDTGAPSVLGQSGPNERDVNLANAKMLKMRLEQLGASVVLTREDNDTTRSLYERMAVAQKTLPDFFISMHHNSVAESVDANLQSGVEAYYYEPFSAALSETVARAIADNVYARNYRFSQWSYYTVTRMRYTPSILCEIGFVPNPVEFNRICNLTEIYKTANAISSAMLEIIAASQ